MSEVHWGVDGRRHRVGANGQTMCRTMIDYSRPPEDAWISGCSVCDIVWRDVDSPDSPATSRTLVVGILVVGVLALLVLAALT
jgi:hypothetical protein